VSAWRALKRDDAVLLVVGPEMPGHPLDAGPEVRRAALEAGPESIRLHGPSDDVRPLLAAADLFVQPSHYEAFGLSAIEAMSTARPVVATRVGALAEYLRDGDNALLCEPHDPDALGSCIARALDDPQLSARLAARARVTVEEQFDEGQITRRWVECLQSLGSHGLGSAIRAVPSVALLGTAAMSKAAQWLEALALL
jgi:glycosyltransferase involved in cell wall biosynthesis